MENKKNIYFNEKVFKLFNQNAETFKFKGFDPLSSLKHQLKHQNMVFKLFNLNDDGLPITTLNNLNNLNNLNIKHKLTNLNNLNNLNTKQLILYYLMEQELTITQLSNKTKSSLQTISMNINNKRRNTGLIIDNLIDKKLIKQKDHYYITREGLNYINNVIDELNEKEYEKFLQTTEDVTIQGRIEKFKEFINKNYYKKVNKNLIKGLTSFIIDYQDLTKFSIDLSEYLLEDSFNALRLFELALKSMDFGLEKEISITPRFINLPKSSNIKIGYLRGEHLNTIISVEGMIKIASTVRPNCTSAVFECPSCGNRITVLQLGKKFKEPGACGCGRKGKFRLLDKELVDAQHLKLEELSSHLMGRSQPAEINVILKGDLTNPNIQSGYNPGKNIRVVGVLQEAPITARDGSKLTRFDWIIDVNSIEFFDVIEDTTINNKDKLEILKLSKNDNIISLLVDSIAPDVLGNSLIKKALLCCVVNGGGSNRVEPHVLLIGDPGTAKSVLAEKILSFIPNARKVSGGDVSRAGLGVGIAKDDFTNGWSLQAGDLPLANGSAVFIDEIDKIDRKDYGALLTGLEQQEVFTNKIIKARLPAKFSCVATANPKLGRFDYNDSIFKQIGIYSPLLNRFDLIIVNFDIPNKEKDKLLANFVIDKNIGVVKGDIDFVLLRKYLLFARSLCPVFSSEAKKVIVDAYSSFRVDDSVHNLNARQLEGMIRFAFAFAKLRLSDSVGLVDAERSVDLFRCSFRSWSPFENSNVDMDSVQVGISDKERSLFGVVKKCISVNDSGFGSPISKIIDDCEEAGLERVKVNKLLRVLKDRGDVFEKQPGLWRLM